MFSQADKPTYDLIVNLRLRETGKFDSTNGLDLYRQLKALTFEQMLDVQQMFYDMVNQIGQKYKL